METIRLSFGKLRELEGGFHNTVIAAVTSEIAKMKNDNEKDVEEEEKNVNTKDEFSNPPRCYPIRKLP